MLDFLTCLDVGLNIIGLLPVPTLSNKGLLLGLIRKVENGPLSPRGRNVVATVKVKLLLLLVIVIA